MRARILAASICLAALPQVCLADPTTVYDGHWRVDLETSAGNGKCEKGGSAVLLIKGARIVGIDRSDITPWGYIDEANTFVGHFLQGDKRMNANGEVRGGFAYGPWSSPSEYCGGRWTARKID